MVLLSDYCIILYISGVQTGTYWYHAHMGTQISMGIHGAFIIRQRYKSNNSMNLYGDIPGEETEHVLMLEEYNHLWDSYRDRINMFNGVFHDGKRQKILESIDGTTYSPQFFHSLLINGKGRYYDTLRQEMSQSPLSRFPVHRGSQIRFRVIHSGTQIPLLIGIDGHKLDIVSLDGEDVRKITVDYVIISPGERVDFYIKTNGNDVSKRECYWIRGRPMISDVTNPPIAEAILQYEGVAECTVQETEVEERKCTGQNPCTVLNCPFAQFQMHMNLTCIPVDTLQAATEFQNFKTAPTVNQEYFLNFMTRTRHFPTFTVNGYAFKMPTVSAVSTQPRDWPTDCSVANCSRDEVCQCFHTISTNLNDTVQLVLVNIGNITRPIHPVHLHGHHFQIIKRVAGITHHVTGQLLRATDDIVCAGSDVQRHACSRPQWRHRAWHHGNVPGLNLNGPWKDTVVVPTGGYVIVRYRADNPGLWLVHCHTSAHHVTGMAVVVREAMQEVPAPPHGFPTCKGFDN